MNRRRGSRVPKTRLNGPERKARRALEKSYLDALKLAAKHTGWTYLKPTPFRKVGEWFVDLNPMIWTDEAKSELWASVKPFEIDDLMARILGFEGLQGRPLSLRARGPYSLVRAMFTTSIERGGDVDDMIAATIEFMDDTLVRLSDLTLESFVEFTKDDRPAGLVSDSHIAALILANRNDDALALCETAIATNQLGSNCRMTEAGQIIGFFELAKRWMVEKSDNKDDPLFL